MLSHRIDYAHLLVGQIKELVADLRNFVPTRDGQPSDVDDWVAMLCRFANNFTTGDLESTKLATSAAKGTLARTLSNLMARRERPSIPPSRPLELMIGKKGDKDLHRIDIPKEFLVYPGSPHDPNIGEIRWTTFSDTTRTTNSSTRSSTSGRVPPVSLPTASRASRVMDAAVLSERTTSLGECA